LEDPRAPRSPDGLWGPTSKGGNIREWGGALRERKGKGQEGKEGVTVEAPVVTVDSSDSN